MFKNKLKYNYEVGHFFINGKCEIFSLGTQSEILSLIGGNETIEFSAFKFRNSKKLTRISNNGHFVGYEYNDMVFNFCNYNLKKYFTFCNYPKHIYFRIS